MTPADWDPESSGGGEGSEKSDGFFWASSSLYIYMYITVLVFCRSLKKKVHWFHWAEEGSAAVSAETGGSRVASKLSNTVSKIFTGEMHLCTVLFVFLGGAGGWTKELVSFIKDLTGGDEQSARRNYEHKRTFVFNGMAHVPCNKIPQMDDMCGGGQRRIRSVPYGSRFVERTQGTCTAALPPHHYYKDDGLAEKFESWKHCMMHEILTVAMEKARRPAGTPWHNHVERQSRSRHLHARTRMQTCPQWWWRRPTS